MCLMVRQFHPDLLSTLTWNTDMQVTLTIKAVHGQPSTSLADVICKILLRDFFLVLGTVERVTIEVGSFLLFLISIKYW